MQLSVMQLQMLHKKVNGKQYIVPILGMCMYQTIIKRKHMLVFHCGHNMAN